VAYAYRDEDLILPHRLIDPVSQPLDAPGHDDDQLGEPATDHRSDEANWQNVPDAGAV